MYLPSIMQVVCSFLCYKVSEQVSIYSGSPKLQIWAIMENKYAVTGQTCEVCKFWATNEYKQHPVNYLPPEEHPIPIVTHFADETNDHLSTINSSEAYIISGA
jgi:hypothetical protein